MKNILTIILAISLSSAFAQTLTLRVQLDDANNSLELILNNIDGTSLNYNQISTISGQFTVGSGNITGATSDYNVTPNGSGWVQSGVLDVAGSFPANTETVLAVFSLAPGSYQASDFEINDAVFPPPFRASITVDGNDFFPIVSSTTLPITISQFTATKLTERSAKLFWETSLEINSDYFIIQRSSDAHNWENIGSVDAAGNSTIAQSYDFIDSTIPTTLREDNSTYFYRLAMVDLDERFDLSEIRTVAFDPNVSAINVYPNPTAQNIIIDLTSIEGASTVQLIDITGKLIYEQKVTDEYNSIPVLNLQQMGLDNGTYLVRITETLSKQVHTKKVLFID